MSNNSSNARLIKRSAIFVVLAALLITLSASLNYLIGEKPWPWQCDQLSGISAFSDNLAQSQIPLGGMVEAEDGVALVGNVSDPGSNCYVGAFDYSPSTGQRDALNAESVNGGDGSFQLHTYKLHAAAQPEDRVIEVVVGNVNCAIFILTIQSGPGFRDPIPDSCLVAARQPIQVVPAE